jgi:hypothetical protein
MCLNASKSSSIKVELAYSIMVHFLIFDLFEKKRLKKKTGGFIELLSKIVFCFFHPPKNKSKIIKIKRPSCDGGNIASLFDSLQILGFLYKRRRHSMRTTIKCVRIILFADQRIMKL